MIVQHDIDQLDLNEVVSSRQEYKLQVASPEKPEELASRLLMQQADATHARWRATAVYTVALTGLVAMTIMCVYIILSPQSSAENKAWVQPILAALVAGVSGFALKSKIAGE
jgi:hypothetical protein